MSAKVVQKVTFYPSTLVWLAVSNIYILWHKTIHEKNVSNYIERLKEEEFETKWLYTIIQNQQEFKKLSVGYRNRTMRIKLKIEI